MVVASRRPEFARMSLERWWCKFGADGLFFDASLIGADVMDSPNSSAEKSNEGGCL